MKKPKLIKQNALPEGQPLAQVVTPCTSAALPDSRKLTATLKDWVTAHQQTRPVDPRTAFAALFVQPQVKSV